MKTTCFKMMMAYSLIAFATQGADIYVATTGNDTTGDGSAANPFETIAAALGTASAAGGDTIHVGPGLYEITAQIEVTNATTIVGTAGRDATEVRRAEVLATNKKPGPDFQSRCLYICHPGAKVEGITFSRGYLYCDSATDTTDRLLDRGAGVYIDSGTLISCAVTNCYIGRSKVGGALALQGANAFVSNCLVRANRSYGNSWENLGTGVTASGGEIVDSAICDNVYVGSSYPRGTGLFIEKPLSGATPVTVRRCRITGNYDNAASYVSYWGTAAGVQIAAPDALLENCLIAGNSTHGNGGGAYVNGARAKFVNCTIVGNSAQYGGGVHNYTTSGVVFWNCIIQGNTAESDTSAGAPEWRGGSASNFSYSLSPVGFPAGGVSNVTDTATFQPGGYRIAGGSPGYNAGSTDGYAWLADTVDLAGDARIWGDAIDMGCYEYSSSGLDVSISASAEKVLLGNAVTLTALVVDAEGQGYTVAWHVDGASEAASTASTFCYTPATAGEHNVSLVVTATGGTEYDGGTAIITAVPTTLHVVNLAEHPGTVPALPYDTESNAFTNIHEALAFAMDGVKVLVHPGNYAVTNEVALDEAVALISTDGPSATSVRNVSGTGRAFMVNNSEALLAGFSATGTTWNARQAKGAGVYVGSLGGTVSNCVFSRNVCLKDAEIYGAGAYVRSGLLIDCEVSGNRIQVMGGAGYSFSGGAGVFMSGGVLKNCSIVSNIFVSTSAPGASVADSPVNQQKGGGIRADGGVIVNCLVAYNAATNGPGGGIFVTGSAAITNCTIAANYAGTYGGGVFCAQGTSSLANVALAGNSADSANDEIGVSADASSSSFSHCFAPEGTLPAGNGNVFGTDARFRNAGAGDFRPSSHSPLHNKGLYDASWMDDATDLAGNPRVDHYKGARGLVDIGCYEAPYVPDATVILLR